VKRKKGEDLSLEKKKKKKNVSRSSQRRGEEIPAHTVADALYTRYTGISCIVGGRGGSNNLYAREGG